MEITLCVTSCGRLDLLKPTLESLSPHFHLFKEALIIEDSGSTEIRDWVEAYIPRAKVILNEPQLGQMKSIDKMYSAVKTPLIFHCEDDWVFDREDFVTHSGKVLMEEPDVSAVLVRRASDYRKSHFRKAQFKKLDTIDYIVFSPKAHNRLMGYSFNPGMVKTSLWEEHGPFASMENEGNISARFKELGKTVACLNPGHCYHIGDDAHVDDPFQPIRPKNRSQKLRRSLEKRITQFIPTNLNQ